MEDTILDPPNDSSTAHSEASDARRLPLLQPEQIAAARRRFLKAGAVMVPLVLTAKTAKAQAGSAYQY